MKFLFIRRIMAINRLWMILFLISSVGIGTTIVIKQSSGRDNISPTEYFNFLFLGASVGFFITWGILFCLHRIIAWLNGAPFARGDEVQVLAGKYRGQIGKVYDIWEERSQVREESRALWRAQWLGPRRQCVAKCSQLSS